MVGNNFTWADLHLFFFCTEDFLDSKVWVQYTSGLSHMPRVFEILVLNIGIPAPGHLLTTFKIQNGHQAAPKWPMGSEKGSTPIQPPKWVSKVPMRNST